MDTPSSFTPIFRLMRGGNIGEWSAPSDYFKATLLGLVSADVHYSGHIFFHIESRKIDLLEKKVILRFDDLKLELERDWPPFRNCGRSATDVLVRFRMRHPKEWTRIKAVSDWILSLPSNDTKEVSLPFDMWERVPTPESRM
ncbi:MAG: hypothetical protein QOG91_280 [Candidatus Parcubacteria bacterium]|jgi:hypothetical protein|nr:hypothetical protein [Candidatus Parcubacteria bacterium]